MFNLNGVFVHYFLSVSCAKEVRIELEMLKIHTKLGEDVLIHF